MTFEDPPYPNHEQRQWLINFKDYLFNTLTPNIPNGSLTNLMYADGSITPTKLDTLTTNSGMFVYDKSTDNFLDRPIFNDAYASGGTLVTSGTNYTTLADNTFSGSSTTTTPRFLLFGSYRVLPDTAVTQYQLTVDAVGFDGVGNTWYTGLTMSTRNFDSSTTKQMHITALIDDTQLQALGAVSFANQTGNYRIRVRIQRTGGAGTASIFLSGRNSNIWIIQI